MAWDLAKDFADFLESIGLNPIYVSTAWVIVMVIIFYRKDIDNWELLSQQKKNQVIAMGFVVIVMLLGCLGEALTNR